MSNEKDALTISHNFMEELNLWTKAGTIPKLSAQSLSYSLELEYNRLKNNNISIEDTTKLNDFQVRNTYAKVWDDNKYCNKMAFIHYLVHTDYLVNEKHKYSFKDKQIYYFTVTWLKDQNTDTTYSCPNCGSIIPIKELLNGCPNCQTKFLMSDLFPKVTNYYSIEDFTKTPRQIGKVPLIGALLGLLGGLTYDTVCKLSFPTDLNTIFNTLKDVFLENPLKYLVFLVGGLIGAYLLYVFF